MGSHNNEITSFVIGRLNNPFRRMLIFHMNDIAFQTVRGPSLCRSIENFLGSRSPRALRTGRLGQTDPGELRVQRPKLTTARLQ